MSLYLMISPKKVSPKNIYMKRDSKKKRARSDEKTRIPKDKFSGNILYSPVNDSILKEASVPKNNSRNISLEINNNYSFIQINGVDKEENESSLEDKSKTYSTKTNLSNDKNENMNNIDEQNGFIKENNKILNKINDIINTKPLNDEKLIEYLKRLMIEYPVINNFDQIKSDLFSTDSFDIFTNYDNNKFLFVLNLGNIIPVLNLLWIVSKENPQTLKKYMSKLDLYFSFVKRAPNSKKSEIDFVLLASISENLYNYVSSYGKNAMSLFRDNDCKIKQYLESYIYFEDKFKYDVGYYYEDMNSINLLNNIGDSNCKTLPKIIYYLKKNSVKKLIELNIINSPDNYQFQDFSEDKNEYSGFNEVDLCIYIKENTIIKENDNFKFIERIANDKNIAQPLELVKGDIYFFEFKTDAKIIVKEFNQVTKVKNRYLEAFNNISLDGNFILNKDRSHLISICNKNYNDAKKIINEKVLNQDVIYSNPQVGLNILIKFNKKIKYLIDNIDNMRKQTEKKFQEIEKKHKNDREKQDQETEKKIQEIEKKHKSDMEETEKKFQSYLEIFKKEIFGKFEKDNSYNEYNLYEYALSNIYNPIKIKFLVNSKELNATIIEKYEKIYNCFDRMSKPFTLIYKDKNLLCFKINKYIGKEIKESEEKNDWNNIKEELIKKKNNSSYYEGLLEFLFGKDPKKEDYLIMNSEKRENINYIKNLIIFLAIYENSTAEDKEEKFQSCIVYIAYKLCGIEYIKKLFSNPEIKILEMKVGEKKKIQKINKRK